MNPPVVTAGETAPNDLQGDNMNTNTTLRVHDAADDMIDDLVISARTALQRIEEQVARLHAARDAVSGFLEALRPTPATEPEPAAPKLRAVPDVDPHVCPHCGDVLASRNGLSIHIGRKHKIAKAPSDQQKAREAAAAAL